MVRKTSPVYKKTVLFLGDRLFYDPVDFFDQNLKSIFDFYIYI